MRISLNAPCILFSVSVNWWDAKWDAKNFRQTILQERNVSWWDVYDNNMATWLTSLILIELATRLEGGDSCHAIVFHLFMENAKDLSKVVQNDGISLLSIIKIPNHPRF